VINWGEIEKMIDIDAVDCKVFKRDWRGLRIYIAKSDVIKVQLIDEKFETDRYFQDVKNEYEILRVIPSYIRVNKVIQFSENDDIKILKLKRILGKEIIGKNISFFEAIYYTYQLIKIVFQISVHGIIHGDLAPNNFIVDKDKKIFLIDFGNARRDSFFKCLKYNFFIYNKFPDKLNYPLAGTIIRIFEYTLPDSIRSYYRKIFGMRPYVPPQSN